MLEYLERRASHRKWRLFLCACSRSVWHVLSDEIGHRITEAAEQFADGLITAEELAEEQRREYELLSDVDEDTPLRHAVNGALGALYLDTEREFDCAIWAIPEFAQATQDESAEYAKHCDLLRDIFGNPFRPVIFSPEWYTDTAVSLARTMYESREFSAMPILADALQDAGCAAPAILDHCRQRQGEPGEPARGSTVPRCEHVRGCWVVDLVLGKE
jgi:hypothetical protein